MGARLRPFPLTRVAPAPAVLMFVLTNSDEITDDAVVLHSDNAFGAKLELLVLLQPSQLARCAFGAEHVELCGLFFDLVPPEHALSLDHLAGQVNPLWKRLCTVRFSAANASPLDGGIALFGRQPWVPLEIILAKWIAQAFLRYPLVQVTLARDKSEKNKKYHLRQVFCGNKTRLSCLGTLGSANKVVLFASFRILFHHAGVDRVS